MCLLAELTHRCLCDMISAQEGTWSRFSRIPLLVMETSALHNETLAACYADQSSWHISRQLHRTNPAEQVVRQQVCHRSATRSESSGASRNVIQARCICQRRGQMEATSSSAVAASPAQDLSSLVHFHLGQRAMELNNKEAVLWELNKESLHLA